MCVGSVTLWAASPLVVYIVARLVFAAWFFSKQQHEKRNGHHG